MQELNVSNEAFLTVYSVFQGGGGRDQKSQAQEQEQARREEMKNSILSQVLDQQARARCK